MVRVPRRTHSVSGPTSVHCVLKDVACCCNMGKIQQFYMSMMALRRNPYRKCKKEDLPTAATQIFGNEWTGRLTEERVETIEPAEGNKSVQPFRFPRGDSSSEPFPFFSLPREVRDHVYSYLVVRRGRRTPILEAKSSLRAQKKRATAQRTRERLNLKRIQSGRRPIAPREPATEPVVHLDVLRASKLLHFEAGDCLYQHNWFAISIDNFPSTAIETPPGWGYARITKMQLELQLKDAQRMNSYIDWAPFFAMFPSLRFLRIIPTFHPRYYDWAISELNEWNSAHYIFRAFFRELLASIPEQLVLKLGPSLIHHDDMQLEGKATVGKRVLWDMYTELGTRRDVGGSGNFFAVDQIVDCPPCPMEQLRCGSAP
ncbi:hypothetical protein K458DRAFT_138823 [Lentithecium fluviatile CBS 122367]|uniref:Uncharacterized protein n=1 Tax=Lentithecium fluviatile CBS 122367 TaxID=1168545 RepID=A0A6G1IKF8_9PLEO|nr:hypothetical protein K458DRAFT_138823 [Lentithecium fluviatile CBS 122367]